jgi:hypothetical protein
LIIEYTPSIARPMKEIELVSTENIKSYKVTFSVIVQTGVVVVTVPKEHINIKCLISVQFTTF